MSTPAGGSIGDATIRVTADTSAADLALRGFSRDAQGRIRDVRGRFVADGTVITRSLNSVTTSSDKVTEAISGIRSAALLLSPALIPIAVQAAPIAASVGAAGVAVAAFAAAAAGQAAAITEAADAEKKYQDAVDEHGASSKEAAEAQNAYVRQVQKMPPATRTAAAALSSLKDQYQNWSDALAGDTMPVATKAFQTFGAIFPKLTPLVQGTSTQLDRFVTIAAGSINTPGFDALIARFSTFATGALKDATDGLVHFARTLNTGKISGGASEFMEYVRANGPLVKDTLAKVAEALSNVLLAASNVGPGLLTVVNAFAGLVAAVPPGVITTMLQLAVAIKAVRLAALAMAATSAGVTAFGGSLLAMRAAAVAASGVVPRLTAAIGALSRSAKVALAGTGIGLLLIAMSKLGSAGKTAAPDVDKLSTSLKRLASTGKFTGELKSTFGSVDGLVAKIKLLNQETAKSKETAFGFRIPGLDDLADKVAGAINDMSKGEKSLSSLKSQFSSVDEALSALVSAGHGAEAAKDFDLIRVAAEAQGHSLQEVTGLFPQYKSAVADATFEQQLAAQAMGLFGAQAQQTSAKLAEQKASADGLRQAVQALNDVNRSALGGMIGFEAAIDAATKAAQENAGSLRLVNGQLDLNSPKSQAAASALNDLAAKTDEAAGAARENGSSWSTVNGIYERGRQKLIQAAQAMGLTEAQAKKLAGQILKTPDKTARLKGNLDDLKAKLAEAKTRLEKAPSSKTAKIKGEIEDLKRKIAEAQARINGVHGKTVILSVEGRANQTAKNLAGFAAGGLVQLATGGPVPRFPGGGPVRGPGTGTSDSILAAVSNGEYVIPARRVRQYGLGLFDAIRAGKLPSRAAGTPSVSSLGVGSTRPAPVVNVTYAPQIHFTNGGVIGSQREMANWLTAALESLRLQGRLPRMD